MSEVFGPPCLDQLVDRDGSGRLPLAAFAISQRQCCGREGAFLVRLQRQRLHAIRRRVNRLKLVEQAERPFDHIILNIPFVRDADVVRHGADDQTVATDEAEHAREHLV